MMTNRLEIAAVRRLVCEACGTEFSCDPTGACWCFEETLRMPMPAEGQDGNYQDCLCRDCLRKMSSDKAVEAP